MEVTKAQAQSSLWATQLRVLSGAFLMSLLHVCEQQKLWQE